MQKWLKQVESGIYEMNFPDCNLKYVGQSFSVRYSKHFLNLKKKKIVGIQNMHNTS